MDDSTKLLEGSRFVDERGYLNFFNDLHLQDWKRFYFVENHEINFVRAWHGHKLEAKLVLAISGVALISTVKIDDWASPNRNLEPSKVVLSSEKPTALFIPPGFANGFKNLTSDTKLMFLSSSTLEESKVDDFRYAWDYWNPWDRNFR